MNTPVTKSIVIATKGDRAVVMRTLPYRPLPNKGNIQVRKVVAAPYPVKVRVA